MSSQAHALYATRVSGAGNTFYIIDLISADHNKPIEPVKRKLLVEHLCRDITGVATDGALFLEVEDGVDFRWDFYNSDGSSAEMCGNAARCVALYFYNKIEKKNKIKWKAKEKTIEAKILDEAQGIVQVEMPRPTAVKNPFSATAGKKKITGYFVNTGVPHFVVQSPPDEKLALELRESKDFGIAGANITFVELDESDYIQAVTFERGVENFTLACGTGAVAAAKLHHDLYPQIKVQSIEMPGGVLKVEWAGDVPLLTGPVEFHFDAQFYRDVL